jgi:hypothetical protein
MALAVSVHCLLKHTHTQATYDLRFGVGVVLGVWRLAFGVGVLSASRLGIWHLDLDLAACSPVLDS